MLLWNPKLNCNNCFKFYRECGAPPACKTDSGCDVGTELRKDFPDIETGPAIAGDLSISEFISTFVRAKALYEHNGIVEAQHDTFKNLGLMDEPSFLLELESIWSEAKRKRADDDQRSRKKR